MSQFSEYDWQKGGVTTALREREVRMAVTMVGGVSLAIYENGVAQELFRMVHGRGLYGLLKRITHSHAYVDIMSGTSAGGMNTLFLGAALCADTDLWPTHDDWVRLGGYDALLNSPHKTDARSLFRGNEYYYPELQSVFDQLLNQKNNSTPWLKREPCIQSGVDPATGRYGALDVFVTGTLFRPQPGVYFDARRQPVFTNNYAGVFHLKHRPRRNEPNQAVIGESHFDPRLVEPSPGPGKATPHDSPFAQTDTDNRRDAVRDRLARVARTTSSLPLVFETSEVEARLMNGIIQLPNGAEQTFMGDGGYLNNRPMDLVMETILKRAAHREVARKILFVEPSAVEPKRENSAMTEPMALQHSVHYLTVDGQQGMALALQGIYEHNRKVQRLQGAVHEARRKASQQNALSGLEKEAWFRLRLQELRDGVIETWREALQVSQLQQLHDASQSYNHTELFKQAAILAALNERFFDLLETHCCELNPQVQNSYSLSQIDIFYLKRTALRAAEELYAALFETKNSLQSNHIAPGSSQFKEVQARLRECFHIFNLARIIEKNIGVVLGAMIAPLPQKGTAYPTEYQAVVDKLTSAPDSAGNELFTLWQLCVGCLGELLQNQAFFDFSTSGNETEEQRRAREQKNAGALLQLMAKRSKDICQKLQSDDQNARTNWKNAAPSIKNQFTLLQQLENRLYTLLSQSAREKQRALIGPTTEIAPLAWAGSGQAQAASKSVESGTAILDSCLFPLERAANLPCSNELELVQVSARDVQSGATKKVAKNKLGGDMLGNLSGFLKASWRVNDLMWGRLDGSAALVETLLDYKRLRLVLESDPKAARRLVVAVGRYIQTGHAVQKGHQKPDAIGDFLQDEWQAHRLEIWQWLREDYKNAPLVPDDKSAFFKLRELLLKRHHIEILQEEIPEVLTMMIAEQAEWQGIDAAKPQLALEEMVAGPPGATLVQAKFFRVDNLKDLPGFLQKLSDKNNLSCRFLHDRFSPQLQGEIAHYANQQIIPIAFQQALLGEINELLWHQSLLDEVQANKIEVSKQTAKAFKKAHSTLRLAQANRRLLQDLCKGHLSHKQSAAQSPKKVTQLSSLFGTHPDATKRRSLVEQARQWAPQRFVTPPRSTPDPQKVWTFFQREYKVGEETIADVPPVILMRRIVASVALSLRALDNSLEDDFKQSKAGATVSRVLRFPAFLLNLLYGALQALSQGTAFLAATYALLLTIIFVTGLAISQQWSKDGSSFNSINLWVVFLGTLGLLSLMRRMQVAATEPDGTIGTTPLTIFVAIAVIALAGFGFSQPLLNTSWIPTFWVLSGTVASLIFFSWLNTSLRTKEAPWGIISYQLAGDAEKATAIIHSWDDRAREKADSSLWLDYVFVIFYTLLLWRLTNDASAGYNTLLKGASTQVGGFFQPLQSHLPQLTSYVAALPFFAALCDVVENILLQIFLWQNQALPHKNPVPSPLPLQPAKSNLPKLARSCALTKFTLIGITLLYILGAVWLWGVVFNEGNPQKPATQTTQ